jgi:GDPmannose 4,6-dehydratase
MWRILNNEKAEDFVLATGETHTVREFAELAFNEIGIKLEWKGKGAEEKGLIKEIDWSKGNKLLNASRSGNEYKYSFTDKLKKGKTVLAIDPEYYRPTEVDLLIGNPSKAKKVLGWEAKTTFNHLVKLMIKADLEKVMMRGY